LSGLGRIFEPRRELGRTGFVATVLGQGDLADRTVPLRRCVATLRRALDAGVNVVDTAPGYEDGYSEEIVGRALAGRRDGVFLVDKIDHLDRPVAQQVDSSLARLGLEQVDAFLFHGVSTMRDWELVAASRMEELAACIRAGKARFKGISSHHPDVLRAAIESGLCDLVMFAAGPRCDARYVGEILPLARARGVGTICFKAFGSGKLLGDTEGYGRPLASGLAGLPRLSVEDCVRYIMTCDPDVALLGLSTPGEQDAAFAVARGFAPMTPAEMTALRTRAEEAVRGKGPCWWDPEP